jgi:hypothetical protein
MYRTTQLRDIKIVGEASIPDEVNLIDPTLRGWAILTTGRGLPDPLLPIAPDQDAIEIKEKRDELAGMSEAVWRVNEGELHYRSAKAENTYDPPSHLQYLRPLFEGETVEMSVWWQWGKNEAHPSVGRTVLRLGKEGTRPSWLRISNDLSAKDYVSADQLDPPQDLLAKENLPIDESWNTIKMTRQGDVVSVSLNDQPIADVEVTDSARPGVMRFDDRDVRIRSIKLTGDWPDELPSELMQRSSP